MKKLIVILIVLGTVIDVSAQESFQKDLFSADVVLKYRTEIGLTPQQVERVKKIYDDQLSTFNSKRWDLDAELVALNKNLSPSLVDEKATMVQMEKIMKLEDELKRMKLAMLIKIKNELKEAQQEQLKKLRTAKETEMVNLMDINENSTLSIRSTGNAWEPLFVIIDETGQHQVSQSDFAKLRPEQIEGVSILKDGAAAALYGKQGNNGIVIVTLKKKQPAKNRE